MLKGWHEKFALDVFAGKNATQAYLDNHVPNKAGKQARNWDIKSVNSKASTLLNSVKVQARLKELNKKAEEYANYDRKKYIEELNMAMDFAKKQKSPQAFLGAITAKGKSFGHDVPKPEEADQKQIKILNGEDLRGTE